MQEDQLLASKQILVKEYKILFREKKIKNISNVYIFKMFYIYIIIWKSLSH